MPFLNLTKTRVIVVSAPTRRYEALIPVPELTELGRLWYDVLESLDERVYFLASVDLAHTHLESGPYNFSSSAEPFDIACGRWAATLDSEHLLRAAQLSEAAMSCGISQLLMLDGIYHASEANWMGDLLAGPR